MSQVCVLFFFLWIPSVRAGPASVAILPSALLIERFSRGAMVGISAQSPGSNELLAQVGTGTVCFAVASIRRAKPGWLARRANSLMCGSLS